MTRLDGKRLFLRPLTVEDVTEAYVGWMNTPEVTRFTESSGGHTLESVRSFVRACAENARIHFFAIVERDTGRHIGNIKLGPVDTVHNTGSIGIIIGEQSCWGKGYATEAIALLARHALHDLDLHKVTAGCYGVNKGAVRAFEKAGFIVEGVQKQQCVYAGSRTDKTLLGLLRGSQETEGY